MSFFEESAEMGNFESMNKAGDIYFHGINGIIKRDIIKSYFLLKKSSDSGNEGGRYYFQKLMKEYKIVTKIEEIENKKYWITRSTKNGDFVFLKEEAWQNIRLMLIGNENVGKVKFTYLRN